MENGKILPAALSAMKAAGADEAQATLSLTAKTELNIDAGKLSLLRTTESCRLGLTAFVGGRKGSMGLNRLDESSIQAAAREVVGLARLSPPDDANAIAPACPPRFEEFGEKEPDLAAMYDRFKEFLAWEEKALPKTRLEQCTLDFLGSHWRYANTHGVDLHDRTGIYHFGGMFTTKDGAKSSSFNYSGGADRGLSRPLKDWGSMERLMRQSAEQLEPGTTGEKFTGQILITPDCLEDFIGGLDERYLGDGSLIKGSSPFKGKLGQAVVSPLFTLRSAPRAVAKARFYTGDGFIAEDAAYIEKGVLRGFNLGFYGSRKTGLPKSPSTGGSWVVDPGTQTFDELVSGVERGLLLCRFSGGSPSENGDFQGVAKNSYLIEKGRIVGPVNETMVSGNLGKVFSDISGISRERVDFGTAILPWVLTGGVVISGK
jgi:PmbA protein